MIRYRTVISTAALLMLVSGAGCDSNEQTSAPETEKAPVTIDSSTAPGQQPTQAPVAHAPSAPAGQAIQGKIIETMDAAGYTYVNVETSGGSQWVAMPETKVEVGQEVTLGSGMEMQNFESKTLGRTFESVIFSSGMNPHAGGAGAPAAAAGGDSFAQAMQAEGGMNASNPAMGGQSAASGGSTAAAVPSADVQVEKAEGENGYTIGEIFEKKGELDKQKIQVRGKVMKVSLMIMGKNWVHLQDGTGDAGNKTHDLVVTTMAEPEKDSVVVIEGTLHADRDFGSGYRYDVIVEDAEIK